MKLQNLVLAAALFALASADRAWGDNVYYVSGGNNGATYTFGTVNSAGVKTTIATGNGVPAVNTLLSAPNGSLYGFELFEGWGGEWGSINPATGAYTHIGNLSTYFPPAGGDYNPSYGFSLAFGPSGNLYATGYTNSTGNWNYDYGTLNLTTGAFTKIATSPVDFVGSIAALGNTLYYVSGGYGSSSGNINYTFGTVNSAGVKTTIATNNGAPTLNTLLSAPNGDLYGFELGEGWGGEWGRINPATGAYTHIGNLSTYFPPAGGDYNPSYGFSLAFGPSGNLYATGYTNSTGNWNYDYGTLDLTTGAFTKIATSPVGFDGSLANVVPEPSTFALLGIGAISLSCYAWRRRRNNEEILY